MKAYFKKLRAATSDLDEFDNRRIEQVRKILKWKGIY